MAEGFIKISRKILNWEWYTDSVKMRVLIHCLLKANWKDGRFKGHEIKRGSFATSYSSMSKELKLTVRQVRYAIDGLELSSELSRKKCGHFLVITVLKYDEYQENCHENGTELAQNCHEIGTKLATIEEKKEKKERKNIYKLPNRKNWSSTCNQRDIDFEEIEKTMLANQKEN